MKLLSAVEGAAMLAGLGLPLAPQRLAASPLEAAAAAVAVGFPVAIKVMSERLSHKTDVGGVALDVRDRAEAESVAARLLRIGSDAGDPEARVLVQPMVHGVAEVIVGIKRDEVFGPVVLLGLGGVLTELYRDVSLRLAPVRRADAEEMIAELKIAPLLAGYRGRPAADRGALADLVVRVSRLAVEWPIEELDLNPVIVHAAGEGCTIVDNRLMLGKREPAGEGGRA